MPTVWKIDPVHTHVQFAVRHLMVTNVKGQFTHCSGTVMLDEDDFTRSQVEIEIAANSIDTREPQRDAHLRSADFLEVDKYPVLRFRSTVIKGHGHGYAVTGDLTIRGVTRPVTLECEAPGPVVKDPWGGVRRGFEARGELNRKDFGLVWNQTLETGGVLVGEVVKLNLEVELVRD